MSGAVVNVARQSGNHGIFGLLVRAGVKITIVNSAD
jgi:hypothetical protein